MIDQQEIIGRTIVDVFRTEWIVDKTSRPMIRTCGGFLKLDSGRLFELESGHYAEEEPQEIVQLNTGIADADLIQFEFLYSPSCINEQVKAVVVSTCWASLGCLLSSDRFIHIGVADTEVGIMLSAFNRTYKNTYFDYWTRADLTTRS